jgi:hypothetical protein
LNLNLQAGAPQCPVMWMLVNNPLFLY